MQKWKLYKWYKQSGQDNWLPFSAFWKKYILHYLLKFVSGYLQSINTIASSIKKLHLKSVGEIIVPQLKNTTMNYLGHLGT
jgi:hypothetical protein